MNEIGDNGLSFAVCRELLNALSAHIAHDLINDANTPRNLASLSIGFFGQLNHIFLLYLLSADHFIESLLKFFAIDLEWVGMIYGGSCFLHLSILTRVNSDSIRLMNC